MSADHLPDDVRRWPHDPYQILGVVNRCAPDDARRAYTRLVKHFKPEQYPDQFRLIREAYDAVKLQARYFGAFDPEAPEEGRDAADDDARGASADGADSTAKADSLQAVWNQACRGQASEAYEKLRLLYNSNPQGSELPARLYAMLLADPELDHVRTRCDWLVRGLRVEGPWGTCRQLYQREIDDHPEEALSERFESLLDNVVPPRAVVDLLGWRWQALSRLGQMASIPRDLSRVSPRLEREDEEGWVRLLLKAADYLAWQRTSHFDHLCKEIENHVHMHAILGEDLSRLDFLRELSSSWHKLRLRNTADASIVKEILKLVPLTWTGALENRQRILTHCRGVAEKPEEALRELNEVRRWAPLIAAHLVQTMAWLSFTPQDPREQSTLIAVVKEYLDGVDFPSSLASYALYRRHLLRLCVAEVIAPEAVANMLDPKRGAAVMQMILDDWELRAVCLAHRLILA